MARTVTIALVLDRVTFATTKKVLKKSLERWLVNLRVLVASWRYLPCPSHALHCPSLMPCRALPWPLVPCILPALPCPSLLFTSLNKTYDWFNDRNGCPGNSMMILATILLFAMMWLSRSPSVWSPQGHENCCYTTLVLRQPCSFKDGSLATMHFLESEARPVLLFCPALLRLCAVDCA